MKWVFYPGLEDHPQHDLVTRQMSGFGSMITFETGSLKNAQRMLRKVRVCSLGESLGGVETLIFHPATITHAAVGEKGRKAIGITDGGISVGIEDVKDIGEDLGPWLVKMSVTEQADQPAEAVKRRRRTPPLQSRARRGMLSP